MYSRENTLLNDPSFRLIRVKISADTKDSDSGIDSVASMTVVTPASDLSVQKHVSETGYQCISHLWGDLSECIVWDDSGIVDADNEEIIKVRIRQEKRETIKRILTSTGNAYWWLDLFCARSDMSVNLIGDILKYCNYCVALIDCYPSAIEYLNRSFLLKVAKQEFASNMRMLGYGYVQKMRYRYKSGQDGLCWIDILDDIFGWWYEDFEALDCLASILGCKWFSRVWTLQEAALPDKVYLTAETGIFSDQVELKKDLGPILSGCHDLLTGDELINIIRNTFVSPLYKSGLVRYQLSHEKVDQMLDLFNITSTNSPTKLCLAATDFSPDQVSLINKLSVLARSQRSGINAVDYVYGVLGLLGVELRPSTNDPNSVWKAFRDHIHEKIPDLVLPKDSVLTNAKNMKSVYESFKISAKKFNTHKPPVVA